MEDLEVLQVCVLGIHIELDSGHGDIEVDTVEDLAESRTGRWVSEAQTDGQTGVWAEGWFVAGEGSNTPSSTLLDFGYI